MNPRVEILIIRSVIVTLIPFDWTLWCIAAWLYRLRTRLDNLQAAGAESHSPQEDK